MKSSLSAALKETVKSYFADFFRKRAVGAPKDETAENFVPKGPGKGRGGGEGERLLLKTEFFGAN